MHYLVRQRGSALVEEQNGGLLHDGAGDGELLLLASRQRQPLLAQHRVIPVRQRQNHLLFLIRTVGRSIRYIWRPQHAFQHIYSRVH